MLGHVEHRPNLLTWFLFQLPTYAFILVFVTNTQKHSWVAVLHLHMQHSRGPHANGVLRRLPIRPSLLVSVAGRCCCLPRGFLCVTCSEPVTLDKARACMRCSPGVCCDEGGCCVVWDRLRSHFSESGVSCCQSCCLLCCGGDVEWLVPLCGTVSHHTLVRRVPSLGPLPCWGL